MPFTRHFGGVVKSIVLVLRNGLWVSSSSFYGFGMILELSKIIENDMYLSDSTASVGGDKPLKEELGITHHVGVCWNVDHKHAL